MSKEALQGKGYFYVNNEIFSNGSNANAKLVYMYLCKCADCFGKSWPAHKTIAAACSISVSSVKTAVKELAELQLLTVSHQYREGGGKSSNLYMIMNRSQSNNFWCSPNIFKMNISAKAKLVYLYFCRCCNKERTCYPAHRTTAAACMASVSAVRAAIRELVEAKFLEVVNRFRENNGQTSNLYTVIAPMIDAATSAARKLKGAASALRGVISGEEKESIGTLEGAAIEAEVQAPQLQKPESKKKRSVMDSIQSYISRGVGHYLTRGLFCGGYERTIPTLRINHKEGL